MNDLGRYRKLYVRLWRHPGFVSLTDTEKVLALYVLTGPQSNRLGLYVFSIATAAEDLGTVPETLKKRLRTVCQTFGWLFDARARVVYVPSFFKWNPPENANVVKGSLKDLNEIPPCGLIDAFAANVETVPQTLQQTFLEGLRQRLPHGSPNQEQYQDLQYQDSGTGEQKPATLRAVAGTDTKKKDGMTPDVDMRVIRKVRDVIRNAPREASTDYLIDAIQNVCLQQLGLEVTRTQAIVVLTQCQQSRSA